MAETKAAAQPDDERSRTGRGTGGLEDHPPESVTPAFSDKPAELPLWADSDPLSDLHALGGDWPGPGPVLVLVSGDAWAARFEFGTGKESPPRGRILDLAGWIRPCWNNT